MNLNHMDEPEENIPRTYNKRVQEKVEAGLKPAAQFAVKMCIQSIFDARRMTTIL